ncbi:MAG: PepSY-like domain-containing protein [Deltaproteobacteria bacterium]|nr:PepSY-like domain-containing protein [Deltaproteobacteria bacterium]
MHIPRALAVAIGLSLGAPVAGAEPACPNRVVEAAKKAVPDAALAKCVAKKSGAGFEAVLRRKDKSLVEVVISAKGELEEMEEVVPISAIPPAVAKAFAARYPKATIAKAEKITKADKRVEFELAFKLGEAKKEATFKADGTFVEEE